MTFKEIIKVIEKEQPVCVVECDGVNAPRLIGDRIAERYIGDSNFNKMKVLHIIPADRTYPYDGMKRVLFIYVRRLKDIG